MYGRARELALEAANQGMYIRAGIELSVPTLDVQAVQMMTESKQRSIRPNPVV